MIAAAAASGTRASERAVPVVRRTMDGHRAVSLELRFSGSGKLDRTSSDDLALFEAARLGEPIRLIVVGEVGSKGFKLNRQQDGSGELGYTCTVRVLSVEAGEIA